ncbi:MAG TPA: hypothetical protein VK044_06590 [Virgibacillus sp.]|nr:hypothetical protein [Virgibacillus sp.]
MNLCFIRAKIGNLSEEVDQLLQGIFKEMDFSWQLEEKDIDEAELIIAKISGLSTWTKEEEVVCFIENHASETFWEYLHGLEITNYPVQKGCNLCESH